MPTGLSYTNDHNIQIQKRERVITTNIIKILRKYGLDDREWIKAISGQFFLLGLRELFDWHKKSDYKTLMNSSLSGFRITYSGEVFLDKSTIQITPEETRRIMQCMQEEDEKDDYFSQFPKTNAKNIDSDRMYFNFHYALLLRIASENNSPFLKQIKKQCLDYLISEYSLDESDGWYPYRAAWITGRILTNLKTVGYDEYEKKDMIDNIIEEAIDSLYARMDTKRPVWRSGFGSWVSTWESTGLCLEGIYNCNAIEDRKEDISRVIDYLMRDEEKEQWMAFENGFESETSSTNILGGTVLASIVYRITQRFFPEKFETFHECILDYFESIINLIVKSTERHVGQFSTIPQILYYLALAIKRK